MNEFENNELKNNGLENNNINREVFDERVDENFNENASIKNESVQVNEPSNGESDYRVYDTKGPVIQNVTHDCNTNATNQASNEIFNQHNHQFENQNFNGAEPINNGNNSRCSSIQFVTSDDRKKKKANRKFAKRAVAACATVAVFGCSIGVGLTMGRKTSDNMSVDETNYASFKFSDNIQAEQMSIADNNEIINIVKNVSNSVVNISIKQEKRDFFNQTYENKGSGSGIIYKEDNEKIYVVTNNHVIDGATSVNISITGTEQIAAKLVGKDAQSDIAVISVLKSDLKAANITDIKVAEFADSENAQVGEYVLAIGNALGQGKTVTQGIISAQNKNVNIDGKKLNVLQTDAAINPGNSGGALVNSQGKIIGMNTAKLAGSTVEGTGYALPSSVVKSYADEIIANGTVSKPYLGIVGFTMSDDFISMYNIKSKGVFIRGVEEGSAAKEAGIRYSDIITAIDGVQVATIEELSAEIAKHKVGDTIKIDFLRNGEIAMSATAMLPDMNSKF